MLDDATRAALLVFRGRLCLYKVERPNEAERLFEQARQCAPREGLPLAAFGEYHRHQQRGAEAQSYFRQAIELSPDQPHGYLGLGLYYEDQAQWEEADDWHDRAVEKVWDERDPLKALGRLLAPVSGNAYLCLARAIQLEFPAQALEAINRALLLRIVGKGSYPERHAYRLKGEILADMGRDIEAAQALYEAARRCNWERDDQTARELLERARQLNPDYLPIDWYLSEAWLGLSFSMTGQEKTDAIGHGIQIWDTAVKRGLPDIENYWAYCTRALLAEQEATLLEGHNWGRRIELWWQAIAYLERLLLLHEKRGYDWAVLGKYFNWLELQTNALDVTAKGIALAPNDLTAAEQRMFILANVGNWPEAEQAIERRLALANDTWVQSVRAFVLYHQGKYTDAADIMDAVVAADPDNLWNLNLRAVCNEMSGIRERLDKAREDRQRIYERFAPEDSNNRFYYGVAARKLGKYSEAITIFAPLLDDPIQRGLAHRNCADCYLLSGDPTSARYHLIEGTRLLNNQRELDQWANVELPYVKDRMPSDLFQEVERCIAQRRDELQSPPEANEELLTALSKLNPQGNEDNWVWIGVQASLARVYLASGTLYWRKVADIYQRLLALRLPGEELAPFPEARHGLRRVIDNLQNEADKWLQEGYNYYAQQEHYRNALLLAQALKDDDVIANLHTRLGLGNLRDGNLAVTLEHFAAAISHFRRDRSDAEAGAILGSIVRQLILDPERFYALDQQWQALEDKSPPSLRVALASTRQSLSSFLDEFYQLAVDTNQLPTTSPVAVDLSKTLLPKGTEHGKWILLDTHVAEMRDRIEREMGVRLPNVWLRGSENLEPNTYYVMLREIPYPPESVPDNDLGSDPFLASVRHIESFLRLHLDQLMGLQETEELLDRWAKDAELARLIASLLPDQASHIRFARVLRELLHEQVPITRARDILEAHKGLQLLDGVSEPVRAVRLRLKEQLPGNRPNVRRIELPLDLEDSMLIWLWDDGGKKFLAAPAEDIQEWLSTIRGLLGTDRNAMDTPHVSPTALLVYNPELRLPLERLVELEFPNVGTISEEELLQLKAALQREHA